MERVVMILDHGVRICEIGQLCFVGEDLMRGRCVCLGILM